MAQIESHEITVRDKAIHCEGCEARIQSVLTRMPGVQEAKASHKTQKVGLTLDSARVSLYRFGISSGVLMSTTTKPPRYFTDIEIASGP